MKNEIKIDFNVLDEDINQLIKLKNNLKKPKYSSALDTITNNGSGNLQDEIDSMSVSIGKYYKAIENLLNNTINYLNNASKTMRKKDMEEARKIKEKR